MYRFGYYIALCTHVNLVFGLLLVEEDYNFPFITLLVLIYDSNEHVVYFLCRMVLYTIEVWSLHYCMADPSKMVLLSVFLTLSSSGWTVLLLSVSDTTSFTGFLFFI